MCTSPSKKGSNLVVSPLPGFEKGHCYEPYIQNGNFTTSDPTYNLGAIVEFSCDPGHSLEQGPAIIECINVRDPYWNDTEPLCRGENGEGGEGWMLERPELSKTQHLAASRSQVGQSPT